jgi:hypothetical protein
MIHVISLGAGVQSTTMALMAARGEIAPMPDCAIFADTGAEPQAVYEHLKWLQALGLPFPVFVVSAGNLREQILATMRGEFRLDARPPFFVIRNKQRAMLNRQCTHDLKVTPIRRKIVELLGGRRPKGACELWIGISLDEALRMKPSDVRYIDNRFPLIEKRMSRRDCLAWLTANGYPRPPKSACTFCPYHNDEAWRTMKREDPESFADAVAIDAAIRPGLSTAARPSASQWFVHGSLKPLDEVDLSTARDWGQLDLFNNECEGMCGV